MIISVIRKFAITPHSLSPIKMVCNLAAAMSRFLMANNAQMTQMMVNPVTVVTTVAVAMTCVIQSPANTLTSQTMVLAAGNVATV